MILKYLLFRLALFLITSGIILFIFIIPAFADDTKVKHIGIEWSQTCLVLIELGDLETCGNPEQIKQAYTQNPLKANYQKMFDDMALNDKAPYQKNNIYNNHVLSCIKADYCNVFNNYYFNSNTWYWFDIPNEARSYLDKIITINAHMKPDNLNTQNEEIFTNATARFLILDTNQINIRSCNVIAYTPEPYRMLMELGGLMWHILDDCKDNAKLGVLNAPFIEIHNKTIIPVNDSPAWLELQRLEALKAQYKENRLGTD
jgi:hypothetical protein